MANLQLQIAQTNLKTKSLADIMLPKGSVDEVPIPGEAGCATGAWESLPTPNCTRLPKEDLLTRAQAAKPIEGSQQAILLQQFQQLSMALEASLGNGGLPHIPAAKPDAQQGVNGGQLILSVTPKSGQGSSGKTDSNRERSCSPESKRRATGSKGEDMEA